MAEPNRFLRAAHIVLTQTFDLRANQTLLMIADVDAIAVADLLTEVAAQAGIVATTVYVPRRQQQSDLETPFPHTLLHLISESDALISCLSDRSEHTQFRLALLEKAVDARHKVIHAPGLTADSLCMADTDYSLIHYRGMMLARAILFSETVEICTVDNKGEAHKLFVKSGQWELPPGISNGLLGNHGWTDLPPGETFLIPVDGHGEIVINGSLPGKVLAADEEILLHFVNGQCVDVQASQALRDYFYATQASTGNDTDWRNLAEFGFGLNPAIQALTGVALVDEKMAGTVHIGLGRNDLLGGPVETGIHCDLVVTGATVQADGRLLLDRGEWAVQEADWLMDYRTVAVPAAWWESVQQVRYSGNRIEERDQLLQRVWGNGNGQSGVISVGNAETAAEAHQLFQLLPRRRAVAKATLLQQAADAGMAEDAVKRLLWIMEQYDIIAVDSGLQ